MNNILRVMVTAWVWVMVTVLGIVSIVVPGGMTVGAVFITLLGLSFAYATTRGIWRLGDEDEDNDQLEQRREVLGEKRKRGTGDTKTDMLLALMDDDEREAFKRALQDQMLRGAARLNDDGELDGEIPLADLLREDDERRR
jgi:hypothetical protein